MQEAEIQIIQDDNQVNRNCKTCNAKIGKGKQYCEPCRKARKHKPRTDEQRAKERERAIRLGHVKNPMKWLDSANFHFKRDESGSIKEKFCTGCETWKAPDSFGKRKDTPSGLVARCKSCYYQQHKKYQKPKEAPRINCVDCGALVVKRGKSQRCKECACERDKSRRIKRIEESRISNQTIHVITHRECVCCKQTKPLSMFAKNGDVLTLKIRPRSCNECKDSKERSGVKRARKNPKHKVRNNISKSFREIMKSVKRGGSCRLSSILGCTTAYFRIHLESQFKKGMRWENYGTTWHIDHILPSSSFDHNDQEQVKRCWHYTNLRPLCAIENIIKSDTIITCQPELLLCMA